MKILIVGDFRGNTGPAIVNKNIIFNSSQKSIIYTKARTKLTRIVEFIIKLICVDCVVFSGMSYLNVIGIKICKIFNKTNAYIMHGYTKYESSMNGNVVDKFIKRERFVLDNIDQIICVSKKFKEYLLHEEEKNKNKITYINNKINWDIIDKDLNCDIERKNNRIISIGGGLRLKNNIEVCKAIQYIHDNYNLNLEYIVIGKPGTDKDKICRYKFVKYIEYMSNEEIINILRSSKLYIQNSYMETFGLAIFEALMCGVNILVSKNVGALSLVNKYENTDIIEDNEDFIEIATKILKNIECDNNSRICSEIHKDSTSWKSYVSELIEILENYEVKK